MATLKRPPPILIPVVLLTLVLGFTIPFPLAAQQTNAPLENPTDETVSNEPNTTGELSSVAPAAFEKRYRVEVIVFNHLGPISSNGEIWHRVSPIEFSPESYRSGVALRANDSLESTNEPNSPIQFTELEILLPYLSKLHSDTKYEVVTYTAWTQPLYEKKESVRVELIPSLGAETTSEINAFTQPSLTGSIQLFENRLLFVDLDIKNDFNSNIIDFSDSSFEEVERPSGTHRLREKRRVKLNEIHYFDHPFFGALVRVSRVEP